MSSPPEPSAAAPTPSAAAASQPPSSGLTGAAEATAVAPAPAPLPAAGGLSNWTVPQSSSQAQAWGKSNYGTTTSELTRSQRIEVMEAWMTGGLAISRLDDIRNLLRSLGVDMVDSSHLRQYIPFLESEERLRISAVMKNECYSVSFDGSPIWHQECFGVMVRICTEDLVIVQNLIRLHLLEGSMNADNIAVEVSDAIQDKAGLERAKCLAFVYDSCAANLKSIRTAIIPMFFRGAHGLQCMSHLCQNIGGRIEVDMADRLVSGLRSLLSQSFANRAFLKQKVGKRWKSINSVRWGASHESNQDIMENFADMRLFLAELVTAEGKDNKTARRLLKLVDDPVDGLLVKLQLAVLCDVGLVLHKATYALESDKPMVHKVWDIMQTVVTLLGIVGEQITNPILSNMEAVIRDATKNLTGVALQLKKDEVRGLCMTCIEDLREYAWERVGDHDAAHFRNQLLLFKAARVIRPSFVGVYGDANELVTDMQGLLAFKFMTPEMFSNLTKEVVTYFPIVKHLPDLSLSTKNFWLAYKKELPTWFDLVRKLWLFQPSSAMMERAFFVMNNVLGKQQMTLMSDLFELTVMLRHNRGVRRDARKD